MEYSIRDVRRDDREEAALLADLWNASDAGWPEGLTQGMPMTAERMLERLARPDWLLLLAVQAGGELVGYGDACREAGRDDVALGMLITVRPDWHDRGCGKAIVLAILERLVRLGYAQYRGHTWSGNLKAIPLYKKTGFFWRPGTGAALQNFIPAALAQPAGRDFFARHDWYRSFRRELAVAPDDIRWQGTGVYPYRFESGGDLFAMTIDRQAETPTAIETNDFRAACFTGRERIVCGIPQTLTWEIVNKRPDGRPLRVELSAAGPPGVELGVAERLEVADALRLERRFVVSPEIGSPPPGRPAHTVTSRLTIDGVAVTLGTGLATVQPIELDVQGLRPRPGKPDEEVVVRLYNRLPVALAGEVRFEPCPGLAFDRPSSPFELPADAWASCRFRVASGDGARATRLRAVCSPEENPALPLAAPLATRALPVTFRATPLDHVYAWEDEPGEEVTIEAPTFWVRTALRDGASTLHERGSGRLLLRLAAPAAGPPFADAETPLRGEHRIERDDGRVRVILTRQAAAFPGVTVIRTLTVGAGPWLRLDHRLSNAGDVEQRLRLRCPAEIFLHRGVTVPLAGGLVHEVIEGLGDFPLGGGKDLPRSPEAYGETWLAREEQGVVAGLVWRSCAAIEDGSVLFAPPSIPPRAAIDLDPLYWVAARGDWEVVRDLWRRLWGSGAGQGRPAPRPVLSAGFEPSPLLVTGAVTTAALAVRNRRLKPFDGRWELRAPGLDAEPPGGGVSGLTPASPAVRRVTLTCRDLTPRVVPAAVHLASAATEDERAAPILVAGDAGREVDVGALAGGEQYAVDNGRIAFTVAPGHRGSLTSLRAGPRELLLSSFPEPRPYQWMPRWCGGVEPFAGRPGDPCFIAARFAGGPVRRQGSQGVEWSGVRVMGRCPHAATRWLAIAVEYLTLGASNLVALVLRLTNTSGAPQEIPAGFAVFPRVTPESRLRYEVRRPGYLLPGTTAEREAVERLRRPMPHGFRFGGAPWTALEEAGTTLVLTPLAPAGEAGGWLLNRETGGLYTESPFCLEPGEAREKLAWLAVVDDPAEARGYRALGALEELP